MNTPTSYVKYFHSRGYMLQIANMIVFHAVYLHKCKWAAQLIIFHKAYHPPTAATPLCKPNALPTAFPGKLNSKVVSYIDLHSNPPSILRLNRVPFHLTSELPHLPPFPAFQVPDLTPTQFPLLSKQRYG